MAKYTVLRAHLGERHYEPGEEREANPADVAHLVANGVLKEVEEKKAKPAPKNKAKASAKNKAG